MSINVEANIDVHDLAEAMTFKQFEELARIFGSNAGKDAALRAIAEIRRGDLAEAITTLEREFTPKWGSPLGAKAAYDSWLFETRGGGV